MKRDRGCGYDRGRGCVRDHGRGCDHDTARLAGTARLASIAAWQLAELAKPIGRARLTEQSGQG